MSKGLNMQSVKSENRSLVLFTLNSRGALSRKELSSILGLTPAAVSKICAVLIDNGLIEEVGIVNDDSRSGRKEILLSLRLNDKYAFGVNAERDCITFSVSSLDGSLLSEKKMPFTQSAEEAAEKAAAYLNGECSEFRDRIIGAGICIIGSQEEKDFGIWKNTDIGGLFSEKLGLPVEVENNVKAFALSELIYGKSKDLKSVLFFKWGPGIGSAIVAGGKVYSGNDSSVAEIGHYIINPGGRLCRCGRFGCLETEAGEEAILRETGSEMPLDELIKNCDNDIMNIISHKINLVALALANTSTILNTDNVVMFGSMFSNPTIAELLRKQCLRYNISLKADNVRLSALNSKSDYIGTTALCINKFFFEKSFD